MSNSTLAEVIKPATPRRAGEETDLPLLSMTMHDGLVDQSMRFKKRIASDDTSQYKIVERGQLVVGFPIDEGVLDFQLLHDRAIVSPAYGIWDVVRDDVDPAYLRYFLRSERALSFYRSKLRSTTARRRSLPAETFLSLSLRLPPIDEQRRIAAILDQVGRLASRTQQAADGVDRLPASIFRQMELRGFPEVALGDIVASSQIGLVRSAAQLGDRGSFEYVRMDAISSAGRWRPTMFRRTEATPVEVDKYAVRDGDLLLNTRNTRELVGKAAVYRGPVRLYNNNLMRLRFHEGIAPEYIHGYLWSRTGRQQLEQMKSGTTSVFAVYARDLMSLRLPLPPVDVQQRFSEAVRRVEERRWELERRHVQLSKLGLTLQARAFTGEL